MILPGVVREPLQQHLYKVKALHERDLATGTGGVALPHAIERTYPNANREWVSGVGKYVRLRIPKRLIVIAQHTQESCSVLPSLQISRMRPLSRHSGSLMTVLDRRYGESLST